MFLFSSPTEDTEHSEPDCMTPHVELGMAIELSYDPVLTNAGNQMDKLWGFYCLAICFERVIYSDDDVIGLLGM